MGVLDRSYISKFLFFSLFMGPLLPGQVNASPSPCSSAFQFVRIDYWNALPRFLERGNDPFGLANYDSAERVRKRYPLMTPGTQDYEEVPGTVLVTRGLRNRGELRFHSLGHIYFIVKTYGIGRLPALKYVDSIGGSDVDFVAMMKDGVEDVLHAFTGQGPTGRRTQVRQRNPVPGEMVRSIEEEERILPRDRMINFRFQERGDLTRPSDAFLRLVDGTMFGGMAAELPAERKLGLVVGERYLPVGAQPAILELGRALRRPGSDRNGLYRLFREAATYLDAMYISRGRRAVIYAYTNGDRIDHWTGEPYFFKIVKTPAQTGRSDLYLMRLDGENLIAQFGSNHREWLRENDDFVRNHHGALGVRPPAVIFQADDLAWMNPLHTPLLTTRVSSDRVNGIVPGYYSGSDVPWKPFQDWMDNSWGWFLASHGQDPRNSPAHGYFYSDYGAMLSERVFEEYFSGFNPRTGGVTPWFRCFEASF